MDKVVTVTVPSPSGSAVPACAAASPEAVRARMAAQIDEAERIARADYVIRPATRTRPAENLNCRDILPAALTKRPSTRPQRAVPKLTKAPYETDRRKT
ncbi:MAG: hypothetical protein ACLTTP_07030 [Alistipes ihumii]